MPGTILNLVVYVWFGATAAVAQLPPEVMVDRHLLHAERLMAQGDPVRALEAMQKALDLKMDRDLELPEDFDFKYAEVAFSAGSLQAAMDSVNRYLRMAARDDAFYREALELSLDIEASLPAQNSCSDRPKGAECWMELAKQPRMPRLDIRPPARRDRHLVIHLCREHGPRNGDDQTGLEQRQINC